MQRRQLNLKKALKIEARRNKALTLYEEGKSSREVATQLGVGPTTIQDDLIAVKQNWREENLETIDKRIALEAAYLDLLQSRWWDVAMDLDPIACQNVLRIIDRRIKLYGLDRPVAIDVKITPKIDPDLIGKTDDEIIEILLDERAQGDIGDDSTPSEIN